MADEPGLSPLHDLPEELQKRRRIILGELSKRTRWFIRLRWWVPPSLVAGTVFARGIGFEFRSDALFLLAAVILAYNILCHYASRFIEEEKPSRIEFVRRLTLAQVVLDYAAMFFLVHMTGGVASPFIFFFIFHIILASILLTPRAAWFFSTVVSLGMFLIGTAEYLGWISHHALFYQGRDIDLARQPFHMMVELTFFSASVFTSCFFATSISGMLRKRIVKLAELSERAISLNSRLESLYTMIETIGSKQVLDDLLRMVTSELANVMGVQGISVKLLTEDRKNLYYAAAHGLPEAFRGGRVIELSKSPLNRRVMEGESYITGNATQKEQFQFGEDLEQAQIRSVLFAPLIVNENIIGILGAYCKRPERFTTEDVEFFKLAAGLVAIALENTRNYESVNRLIQERSWFMNKVGHNLRAPLGAILSILEVIREGYLGPLNDQQLEYLRRIDRRARTMTDSINEQLALAKSRSEHHEAEPGPVDLVFIAGRIQRSFQDKAAKKRIVFNVAVPESLPTVWGDKEMIEQMLENLVSNAIKYTMDEGTVSLNFAIEPPDKIRIDVSDTGIGIPAEDIPKLFAEFFRASNARQVEEVGTGLGLAIVREVVKKHHGGIKVQSEQGKGTTFTLNFPIPKKE